LRIELEKYAGAQTDIVNARQVLGNYYELNYAQGLLHLRKKEYDQAQASLQLALTAREEFQPAVLALAVTNYALGNFAQADQLASQYLSRNPNQVSARQVMAQSLLHQQEYAKAEQLLRPVLDAFPDNATALALMAQAMHGQDKPNEEAQSLQKLVQLGNESPSIYWRLGAAQIASGDDPAGLENAAKALSLDPTFLPAAKTVVAYHAKRKDFDAAIEAARAFVNGNEAQAGAHTLLGLALIDSGEIEEGKQALERARAISPDNPETYRNLAALAAMSGDNQSAKSLYQELLRYSSNDLQAMMSLAELERLEGREEEMSNLLQAAIAAHPEAGAPRIELAEYYLQAGSPERVASTFGDYSGTQEDRYLVLELLGKSQIALGNSRDAQGTFSQLVTLKPDYAEGHFLLSQAFAQTGNASRTRHELERALAVNADHFLARLGLAQLLLRERDIEAANEHVRRLREKAPDNLDVLTLEARVAALNGDNESALRLCQSVYDAEPTTATLVALAEHEIGMGREDQGLTRIRDWIDAHGNDISARHFLAKAFGTLGMQNEQADEYRRILQLSNTDIIALNNLAWALLESAPAEALKYATRASELAPDSAIVSDTLAMALVKNGKNERALRASDRAIRGRQPSQSSASLFYHRAIILDSLNRRDQARDTLRLLLDRIDEFEERSDAELLLTRLSTNGSS
jgi:putative PEP-CTERM system TPR-repeat lipoprotein